MTVFVSADTLAAIRRERPDTVRVIEVRRTGDDAPDRHVDGAVVAVLTTDLSRSGAPATEGKRPLPDLPTLQGTVRRWGIHDDTSVVVYDHDGSFVAARAWWVLRWAGLADVSILDGGLPAWLAAGHPVGRLAADVGRGTATLTGGRLPQLDADAAAARAAAGRLVDARPTDAFAAGHIPGARNVSSRSTVADDGTLHDAATLRARYGPDLAGIGLYCGGGVAAAHGVAVLAHLGVTAPLFVGSFSAWSADPRRAVAGASTATGGTS